MTDTVNVIDVSRKDDMYELLAGCDSFVTDYSSAAFDASVMRIPVFLYCDDYAQYESERGSLLWDMRQLPFPMAENMGELEEKITDFDTKKYEIELNNLFFATCMREDGKASERVADHFFSEFGILILHYHGNPMFTDNLNGVILSL